MRINYRSILRTALLPVEKIVELFDDSDRTMNLSNKGDEILETAEQAERIDIRKRTGSLYPHTYSIPEEELTAKGKYEYNKYGSYAISKAASERLLLGEFDGVRSYIPGDLNYRNPAIDIAMQFAIKNGDKKLVSSLKKYEKYEKEAYENYYKAYEQVLAMVSKKERAAERIERLREKKQFINKYIIFSNSELYDEIKKRKDRLEEMTSFYYHGNSFKEIRKLEKEIKILEELRTAKKPKRLLVAIQKEIKEIQQSAGKNRGYKQKYIKFIRKAIKNKKKISKQNMKQAEDIIYEIMRTHGIIEKESYLTTRDYEINNEIKSQLFERLEEEHYGKKPSLGTK